MKGKKSIYKVVSMIFTLLLSGLLSACCLSHEWKAATCEESEICLKCGKESQPALGHDWQAATCTTGKTCAVCQKTEGEPLGHDWIEADCQEPKHCSRCGETEGEPLGHDFIEASCEAARHCSRCEYVEGRPLVHSWTDTKPMQCLNCGYTLPKDSYENGDACYMGIHILFPEAMEVRESSYERTFCVSNETEVFTLTVDRTKDLTMEEWVQGYRSAIESFYTLDGEEDLVLGDKSFHIFNIQYKDTHVGQSVLYVGDRVRAYMEFLFPQGTDGIPEKVNEILATLEEM